jgi:hypothetical protein
VTALEETFHKAKAHADLLLNDVELAATRENHIRLTARANEARHLANELHALVVDEAGAGYDLAP